MCALLGKIDYWVMFENFVCACVFKFEHFQFYNTLGMCDGNLQFTSLTSVKLEVA